MTSLYLMGREASIRYPQRTEAECCPKHLTDWRRQTWIDGFLDERYKHRVKPWLQITRGPQ